MFLDFLEINKTNFVKNLSHSAKSETFPLGKMGNLNIFYLPLLGRVYVCDDKSSKLIPQIIKNLENNPPSRFDASSADHLGKFGQVGILPTFDCNLRCTYCHSRGGDTHKTMSFEFAKKAIDFINDNSDEHIAISFHGGGEPTLAFRLMKKIIEYASRSRNEAKFSLQSNGVFSREIGNWILKNIDDVSISCDGPPYIQDTQRPLKNGGRSSPIVEKTIRYFVENSKDIKVLATLSKFSLNKQAEILDYFYRLGIKNPQFSSIIPMGRCIDCPTAYSSTPDSESLMNNSLKTMELTHIYGIKEPVPQSLTFDRSTDQTCGLAARALFFTPDGFVSPCLFSVSSSDPTYRKWFFGSFDEKSGQVYIDNKKLAFLQRRIVQNIPACQNCFLKWNCSGGCAIRACSIYGRDLYSPHQNYCNWTRKFGREILFYKVQRDLIRIKPFLEDRQGRIIYRGIFNTFELAKFEDKKPENGVILKLDMNKTDPTSLINEIIKAEPKLLLLSFKLSGKNLNLKSGKKIEKFLRTLKSRHIPFIITKPLPKCLFDQKYDDVVKEFRIPQNCEECLELFTLKGNSFHICKSDEKISQKEVKNRKQIYEIFMKSSRRIHAAPCDECVYLLRRKCNGLCL